MNTFFYPLQKLNGFERAKECLDTGKTCQVTGCADSQLAHFITGLSDGYKNKVIVTFSGTKAKELYEDLKAFDKNGKKCILIQKFLYGPMGYQALDEKEIQEEDGFDAELQKKITDIFHS